MTTDRDRDDEQPDRDAAEDAVTPRACATQRGEQRTHRRIARRRILR